MDKQEREYLKAGGSKCPCCGSDNITAGSYDADGDGITSPVECSDCGAEWHDYYKLSGMSLISSGSNPK